MRSFELTEVFNATPAQVYEAWLDSEKHTAMTGGNANCSNRQGYSFSAWDGYITGVNLKLDPNKLIVQEWRTSEFEDDEPSSLLEIELSEHSEGCQLTLKHSQIPDGQSDYENGWKEHYFEPMQTYFTGSI